LVNYHVDGWTDAVAAVPENQGMKFALDCIGGETLVLLDEVLEKCGAVGEGKIATVDLTAKLEGKSKLFAINTPAVQSGELLAEAGKYIKMVDKLLAEGKLVAMSTKVIGGLEEAPGGLEMLKAGKVRGEKLVVKV
jgi:NADPH-dependent curcumin reductase CurA